MSDPEKIQPGYIQRYTFTERVCHWMSAATYTYCLSTGLAFYSPHLFWLALVLGGGPTSGYWHPIIGLLFVAGAVWMHDLWRRDMDITETDKRWLHRVENYAKNQDELLPLSERFNAGQKLFYWMMFYGGLALLLSGVFIWFPEYISFRIAWVRHLMILIHEIAALLTIGGFIVHLYMGIFLVPGSMTAMTVGYVTRSWARVHHRLWYIRATGGDLDQEK